jgi:hypothetical protein
MSKSNSTLIPLPYYSPTTTITTGTSTSGAGVYYPLNQPGVTIYTSTYPAMVYKINSVLLLPLKIAPIKVYVDGDLMTPGLIGSSAHYTYMGDQIIFIDDILRVMGINSMKSDILCALEFKKEIYHYRIGDIEDGIYYVGETKTIAPDLMAVVKK